MDNDDNHIISKTREARGVSRPIHHSIASEHTHQETTEPSPTQRERLSGELRREGELDARDTGNDARRGEARRARQVAPTMPGRAFSRDWKVLAAPLPLAFVRPLPPPASPVPNPSQDLVVAK